MEIFVMMCKDFGAKFKFNAVNYASANSKAKRYCNYHSMPEQFYAIPASFAINGDMLQLHNEWVE